MAFKDYLSTLGEKLGNGKNLIFIIDVLDRCKPRFALEILESIKHLFSVPHITFVLVMNRTQLEEAVRCEYGSGVDASRYLQKFISVWASLPKSNEQNNIAIKTYVRNCLKAMSFETKTNANVNAIDTFEELATYYDLSLREVEKCLTNFAIIHNATNDGDLNIEYLNMAIFLSIIKTIKPDIYHRISRKNIDYNELLTKAKLQDLKASYWPNAEEHEIRWYLKYNLSSEEVAEAMLKDLSNGHSIRLSGQRSLTSICRWMDGFQKN